MAHWRVTAESHAERALEEARSRTSYPYSELEAILVLRVAKHALGKPAEVAALTTRCNTLVKSIGFDRPDDFNGRADLIRLWRKRSSVPTQAALSQAPPGRKLRRLDRPCRFGGLMDTERKRPDRADHAPLGHPRTSRTKWR